MQEKVEEKRRSRPTPSNDASEFFSFDVLLGRRLYPRPPVYKGPSDASVGPLPVADCGGAVQGASCVLSDAGTLLIWVQRQRGRAPSSLDVGYSGRVRGDRGAVVETVRGTFSDNVALVVPVL